MTSTIEITTPPSRIIKTPAKLLTSRLCVLPVLDFEGGGHWLLSSHHFLRVLSIMFLSRSCKWREEPYDVNRAFNRGFSSPLLSLSRIPCSNTLRLFKFCSFCFFRQTQEGLTDQSSLIREGGGGKSSSTTKYKRRNIVIDCQWRGSLQ